MRCVGGPGLPKRVRSRHRGSEWRNHLSRLRLRREDPAQLGSRARPRSREPPVKRENSKFGLDVPEGERRCQMDRIKRPDRFTRKSGPGAIGNCGRDAMERPGLLTHLQTRLHRQRVGRLDPIDRDKRRSVRRDSMSVRSDASTLSARCRDRHAACAPASSSNQARTALLSA